MDDTQNRLMFLIDSSGKGDAVIERELNLPRSTIYDWRKGRSKSYKKYVSKIATYFNVSTDYLLGNEQKEKPAAERSELINKILTVCDGLPEDKQTELLEYAKYLVAKDK